jgi:ATP-dependent exoDNAse (exonuclease V) beta subunit
MQQLVEVIDDLASRAYREGPVPVMRRYLEQSGHISDRIVAGTGPAHHELSNIASVLRFAKSWQHDNPRGNLIDFVRYFSAFRTAGGDIDSHIEPAEHPVGVQLMTVYQAKGLEFPIVFVPSLVENQWPMPDRRVLGLPPELSCEGEPTREARIEEERRLLYVAMTRACDRLILTAHRGAARDQDPSRFISEIIGDAGEQDASKASILWCDRTVETPLVKVPGVLRADLSATLPATQDSLWLSTLQHRAGELIRLIATCGDATFEAQAMRAEWTAELAGLAKAAANGALAKQRQPDLAMIAKYPQSSTSLLQVAPLPTHHSYSSLSVYASCPLRYAFRYLYRIPVQPIGHAALSYGLVAHETFAAFTAARRHCKARGEPLPTREDLETDFRRRWSGVTRDVPDRHGEYERRIDSMLNNFWATECSTQSETILEESRFELLLDNDPDQAPVIMSGSIDRIDRLPNGELELIDYKTGKVSSQQDVDTSLQLSIYALACRDGLRLGAPARVTLFFVEAARRCSTTRSAEQLEAAHSAIISQVEKMRAGDFTATPARDTCARCDYRMLCPVRAS